MNILAIETSCDETCVAILKVLGLEFKVKSNIISSQVKLHAKYGGVWPYLAKREHQKNLPIVFKEALKRAKKIKIDLIAVTIGPGLEPCLWTGVNFARDLAKKWELPIIPINHLEAHIYANWLDSKLPQLTGWLPAICLVVSGGHTQLILMKNHGNYKILGETRDDAAGECFDKVARILGLSYPGGPAIAAEAGKFKIQNSEFRIRLPRPMIYQKNYDFSFSGLKTAVLYDFKSRVPKIRKLKKYLQEICFETQQAIIDVLITKTIRAAKEYKAKAIMLGGGVAANIELRSQLEKTIKKELPKTYYFKPKTYFSTDNAAMVGVAAYFCWLKGKVKSWEDIEANANLRLE